jgi:hypothetical protein
MIARTWGRIAMPHRVFHRFVTPVRQIGRQQGAGLGARRGPNVVLHLLHRHVRGVRITQHHHAQRISDQDQRQPRLVQQLRHGKIVRRERGNFLAAGFARPDRFGGDFVLQVGVHHFAPKLASNSSGATVAVPILPTTIPAA